MQKNALTTHTYLSDFVHFVFQKKHLSTSAFVGLCAFRSSKNSLKHLILSDYVHVVFQILSFCI